MNNKTKALWSGVFCLSVTFAHRILQAAPVNLNVLKEKMTKDKQLKSSATSNMVSIANVRN